jgi:Cdc6-like AAA superfamily ATPase
MTAKNTNSDVRVAIKTLYLSALEPDVPLRNHFEKARRDIMFDVVKDLNDKSLLILKAVLACPDGLTKRVYEAYQKVASQLHEESLSYTAFYSTLSYLQGLGLVVLLSTKVNRAYTNQIQLTFDSSILLTVLQMRFA